MTQVKTICMNLTARDQNGTALSQTKSAGTHATWVTQVRSRPHLLERLVQTDTTFVLSVGYCCWVSNPKWPHAGQISNSDAAPFLCHGYPPWQEAWLLPKWPLPCRLRHVYCCKPNFTYGAMSCMPVFCKSAPGEGWHGMLLRLPGLD